MYFRRVLMLNHFSILQYSIPGRQNNRISGQTGVSHPQCPEMKMYKVLKEAVETTSSGTKSETEMKVGGRVRSSSMKELLSKQLKVGLDSLESQAHMDLKTGTIKNKKEKKAKSPAQLALAEVKQLHNKLLNCITIIPEGSPPVKKPYNILSKHVPFLIQPRLKKCLNEIPKIVEDLETLPVRNSEELVTWRK